MVLFFLFFLLCVLFCFFFLFSVFFFHLKCANLVYIVLHFSALVKWIPSPPNVVQAQLCIYEQQKCMQYFFGKHNGNLSFDFCVSKKCVNECLFLWMFRTPIRTSVFFHFMCYAWKFHFIFLLEAVKHRCISQMYRTASA